MFTLPPPAASLDAGVATVADVAEGSGMPMPWYESLARRRATEDRRGSPTNPTDAERERSGSGRVHRSL